VLSLAAAVFAALNPMLATDTICRYAPMAEAFANGNWAEAFHPRFCIGFPLLTGVVCRLTGLDGLASCSAVASLGWGLCILPIYGVVRRVFGDTAAWIAVILYLLYPQPFIWGLKGMREPFKMLGILLAVEAVLDAPLGAWRNFARAAVACALLAWIKVDTVILMPFFWLAFAIGDRFRAKSWSLAGASALTLLPNCWLVYDWTGVFVPVYHYADIWRKLAC